MLFLVQFDRSTQTMHTFECYDEHQLARAQTDQRELELKLFREHVFHEVVVLEAKNENSLREAYKRYFNPREIELIS